MREVVVAGDFSWVDGNTINKVARWNGSSWQGFGIGTTTASVLALTNWDPDGNGPLVAAPLIVGIFPTIGLRTVNNVASWQGGEWRHLGNGLSGGGQVIGLTTWDPDGPGPAGSSLRGANDTAGTTMIGSR